MEDGQHTTVFLRFTRMMDTYLPSLDGFDEIFTEKKIYGISAVLKAACLSQASDEAFAEVEDVSMGWVRIPCDCMNTSAYSDCCRGRWTRSTRSAQDTC